MKKLHFNSRPEDFMLAFIDLLFDYLEYAHDKNKYIELYDYALRELKEEAMISKDDKLLAKIDEVQKKIDKLEAQYGWSDGYTGRLDRHFGMLFKKLDRSMDKALKPEKLLLGR